MLFTWEPGNEPDPNALERLKQHFSKPAKPAPHAWFMGAEIHYFTGLMNYPPDEYPCDGLEYYLLDVASGLKNFGRFAEWVEWFHYLLPYLVERSLEGRILGHTVSYMINLYPNGITEEYEGFRVDVLSSLGMCLMRPELWEGNDLSKQVVDDERSQRELYGRSAYIELLSPAVFFCLKYLKPNEITSWVESFVRIPSINWHYQILSWIYQATIFLECFEQILLDQEDKLNEMGLGWYGSWSMMTFKHPYDFIPKENIEAFKSELKKHRLLYA